MPGTAHGATCMVAAESSFGSVDATDVRALDDATIAGLTAYSLKITRESFNGAAQALKQVTYERADVTLRSGQPSARVEAAVTASGPVTRLVGKVTLEGELRGFNATAPTSSGFGLLMGAGLDAVIRTPGTSCVATAVDANTFSVDPGDIGKFAIGDIILIAISTGADLFCKVTDRDTGSNEVTTLEPHGISTTATVRQCHMWYPAVDGTTANSLVMQFAHADAGYVLLGVGGKLESMSFVRTGAASIAWRAVVDFPDGEYRDAVVIPVSAPLAMGMSGATPLVCLVSPMKVSEDHSGDSAPYSGTATSLPARTWDVTVTNVLKPIADQGTRSGVSGMKVHSTSATGTFVQEAPSGSVPDWREVLRLGEKRSIGFSAAGSPAAGNGFCFWVGAVETADDPAVTFADDDRTQEPSWRAGDYTGDVTASAGVVANAAFVFAFPC